MTYRMQEDQPTELELIEEMYPGFDPDDYADDEHLADAMFDAHGDEMVRINKQIGSDVHSDPYEAAYQAIDHAADVLWKNRKGVTV